MTYIDAPVNSSRISLQRKGYVRAGSIIFVYKMMALCQINSMKLSSMQERLKFEIIMLKLFNFSPLPWSVDEIDRKSKCNKSNTLKGVVTKFTISRSRVCFLN